MITAFGNTETAIEAMKLGAYDYISKPFSLRELMLRIEALLRRLGKTNPEAQIECQGILFDGNTLTATFEAKVASITRKEMDIMAYLKCHSGRIVSKKELLIEVWRYADADIETRTVDIHMLKLRKKIANLVGDQPVIRIIRGEGYRLEPLA
jgi:two-component system response regulator RegX3